MPVKIRLARRGRKKRPYYHVVVADARSPRDGKYIESIGSYNPMTVPATIELDREKAYEWLMKGAQPTDTARAILKFKGVMYRKHLMRGVEKGVLTEEKANEMYQAWIDEKESKVASRREETKKKKAEFWKMVSGEIKPKSKGADKEAGDAFREAEDSDNAKEEEAAEDNVAETPATAEESNDETATASAETEAKEEDSKEEEKTEEAPKEENPEEADKEEEGNKE